MPFFSRPPVREDHESAQKRIRSERKAWQDIAQPVSSSVTDAELRTLASKSCPALLTWLNCMHRVMTTQPQISGHDIGLFWAGLKLADVMGCTMPPPDPFLSEPLRHHTF